MTGHTPEPLYSILFGSGALASQFVQHIRDAMRLERLHRQTPPGPLVIYGPRGTPSAGDVTLFVTSGILRAAEILQIALVRGETKLNGAGALPHDAIVLFANMGGGGPLNA